MRPSFSLGRKLAAAVFAAVTMVSCSDSLVQPGPTEPDRVLFVRNHSLMVMDADGGNEQRLLGSYDWVDTPQLMPDGRSVLLVGAQTYCGKLLALPLDGGATRTIATGDYCLRAMRASPSAGHVVFVGLEEAQLSVSGANTKIIVMKADGTGLTDLSAALPAPGGSCSSSPTPKVTHHVMGWVSHSRVQLYRHVCGFGAKYFTVNIDGSDVTEGYAGMISPDGRRLLRGGGASLVVTDVTTGVQSVIGSEALVVDRAAPSQHEFTSPWSADGSHIAYQHSGSNALYIARADGSNAQLVAGFPAGERTVSAFWGFAGTNNRVLYTAWNLAAGTYDLYLLTNDGSSPVPLSVGKGNARNVIWIPAR